MALAGSPGWRGGHPPAGEAIELVGFGPAQLQVMILSSMGLSFCDGIELVLVNVVAMATAADFALSSESRASLSMATLGGLMLGSLASGYCGDTFGRRKPILWSYTWTSLFGFACSMSPSYGALLALRAALGCSMGVGYPVSFTLVSEITPEPWRIFVRVCAGVGFALGALFVAVLALLDDPSYVDLHWRRLMLTAAVPPLFMGALATRLLPESPVYLASIGQRPAARDIFVRMAEANGSLDSAVFFSDSHVGAVSDDPAATGRKEPHGADVATFREAIGVMFSRQFRAATMTAFAVSCCMNLVSYGDSYAAPQVLRLHFLHIGSMRTSTATIFVMKALFSLLCLAFGGLLAQAWSRKCVMLWTTLYCALVCAAFPWAGSRPYPRLPWEEAVFQLSTLAFTLGLTCSAVVLVQFAVEIYPTRVSSTGGAFILGGSRIAAVLAPLCFEELRKWTGEWTTFYYAMSVCCLLAASMVYFMPSTPAYRPGAAEDAAKADVGYATF